MRDKVFTCVVTYNRPELLKKCLKSIMNQNAFIKDKIKMDILVWDNSDDKIKQWSNKDNIRELNKTLNDNTRIYTFTNNSENHDASFGFNRLVKYACEHGMKNDYIWIMDDDTIPEREALHELIKTLNKKNNVFANSFVEFRDTKEPFYKNIPRDAFTNKNLFDKEHTIDFDVRFGTFTSMITKVKDVIIAGLPQKEFHIWGDDTEFSERLIHSSNRLGSLSTNSIVHHMTKNNDQTVWELYPINESRMENFYYGYRNRVTASRRRGGDESMQGTIKREKEQIDDAISMIKADDNLTKEEKDQKIKEIKEYPYKGMQDGVDFNPEIEYPENNFKIIFNEYER